MLTNAHLQEKCGTQQYNMSMYSTQTKPHLNGKRDANKGQHLHV